MAARVKNKYNRVYKVRAIDFTGKTMSEVKAETAISAEAS